MWLQLWEQLYKTNWLEWLAFLTALLQVYGALQNKRWNYIFGGISVAIYSYLLFIGTLYAEASLNLYYLIISILGWWQWGRKQHQAIAKSTTGDNLWALGIALVSFLCSYIILSRFTDSKVPAWDSLAAALGWAGAYLMTKRKLSYWLWLTASNIVAIPLFYYKELYSLVLLTLILLVMGLLGYRRWWKVLHT